MENTEKPFHQRAEEHALELQALREQVETRAQRLAQEQEQECKQDQEQELQALKELAEFEAERLYVKYQALTHYFSPEHAFQLLLR